MIDKICNLLNYCYEQSMTDMYATSPFQLFILSSKSLMPYENKIGCMFDVLRYRMEMDLYTYYKNGSDEAVEYYLNHKKPFTLYDNQLEYKIIPVIITNTKWKTLIDEVLKVVIFYTYNKQNILQAILLSSIIYEYLQSDIIDEEKMNEITKERILGFSIKDFFENNFTSNINKNYIIGFEKERIMMIMKNEYLQNEQLINSKAFQYIIGNQKSKNIANKNNEAVLNNFASYLYKLRLGTVNPEKLKIEINSIEPFPKYLRNSAFLHPLLGKCVIVKRNNNEIIIKNKSGLLKVII